VSGARKHRRTHDHPIKALAATLLLIGTVGCASTRTHESTGQYVDDSVITTKVKTAVLGEPDLKSSEIKVETFKGVVSTEWLRELSGWSSRPSGSRARYQA
jgi:hypothetical protein